MCRELGVPVSMEKTEWASELIVFLGILLDGRIKLLAIPEDKRIRALEALMELHNKKKMTVKKLQQLCGFLNFLGKAIFPGRPFIRCMYLKFSKIVDLDGTHPQNSREWKWKQHYHVRLDAEFHSDCEVWIEFLSVICEGYATDQWWTWQ